jgi:hypothetical protein
MGLLGAIVGKCFIGGASMVGVLWLAVFDGTTFGSMFTLQSSCCVLKVSQCEILCLALLVAIRSCDSSVFNVGVGIAQPLRCCFFHPQLRSLLLRLV